MNDYKSLYEFIDLAEKNRKYPPNTAHGKRAALKLFETALHADELESLDLIEERMKEIFLSLISKHRDKFSIQSLNTYKGRLLKLIQDYRKYGINPESIAHWEVKMRRQKDAKLSQDSKKDEYLSLPSSSINRRVNKVQILLQDGTTCTLELPNNLAKEDISIITKIVHSFGS